MQNRRGVTRDLLAAVYPLLNVTAFTSVATGGLHHGQAPQETPLPYGVLQAPAGYAALPAMGTPGEEVRFQLKALSLVDYAVALELIDLAKQLLDGERPVVANHLVLRLWWEWTQVYPEPELVNGVPAFNAVSQWCALVDQVS
jgi:uncharacterized protein DUF3168